MICSALSWDVLCPACPVNNNNSLLGLYSPSPGKAEQTELDGAFSMWVKFSWERVIKTVEKGFNDDLSPEGKLDILSFEQ